MIAFEEVRDRLIGSSMPGAVLQVEPYESAITDYALLAPDAAADTAHPAWLVMGSLRSMGITVEELCALAGMGESDTLLIGTIDIEHRQPLVPGVRYHTRPVVESVDRRSARDGSIMDRAVVTVRVLDEGDGVRGVVRSTYLFKRRSEQ